MFAAAGAAVRRMWCLREAKYPMTITRIHIGVTYSAILVSWFGLQRRKWQQGESND